jgi:hypothetical protein
MDRLDQLMAELDAAVARLDALAANETFRRPDPPAHPPTEPSRARWYWTTDAAAAPPPPAELTETVGPP